MTLSITFLVFVFVLVLDDAESARDRLDRIDDLLLHQVEAHGEQRDAEQQVQRAQGDADFGRCFILRRHEIAEADGGERDEAEISRVEQFPTFPLGEEAGAGDYVADDEKNAQPNGHRLDRRLVKFRLRVVHVHVLVHHFVLAQTAESRAALSVVAAQGWWHPRWRNRQGRRIGQRRRAFDRVAASRRQRFHFHHPSTLLLPPALLSGVFDEPVD